MPEKHPYTLYFICGLILIIAGWFAHSLIYLSSSGPNIQIRENSPEYHFINPLILTDNPALESPEYKDLQFQMKDVIMNEIQNANAIQISVYFRDLNSAKATGINQGDLYAPSSMLKLATLMAYLKLTEKNPDVFTEKLYYKYKNDSGQFFKPTKTLSPGYYTVRELLVQMIVYSDNSALYLLNANQPEAILNVYKELQLPSPLTEAEDFMSPQSFSRLFRSLFNSTFFSRPYSEEALKLLSLTDFDMGIAKGVPSSITVSHKFGEHTTIENNVLKQKELHDCGIIYYPRYPYFFCVMTKGNDFVKLEKVIGEISGIVYQYVDKKSHSGQ